MRFAFRSNANQGSLALTPRHWLRAPTLDAYTRDDLIDAIPSVLRKGQTLDREALMHALLHHLGFQRLTEPAQETLKGALNGAIRLGILESQGQEVRRISYSRISDATKPGFQKSGLGLKSTLPHCSTTYMLMLGDPLAPDLDPDR